MLKAADLLDEARDYHESFSPQLHPDKILLRRLSATVARLVHDAVDQDPDVLAITETFSNADIVTAMTAQPLALSRSVLLLLDAEATDTRYDTVLTVTLVPHNPRLEWEDRFPSLWRDGEGLRPIDLREVGSDEHGWENLDDLVIRYVPEPAPLVSDSAGLELPDLARPALVADLALFMASRTVQPVSLPQLVQQAQRDYQQALAALTYQSKNTVWRVRKV